MSRTTPTGTSGPDVSSERAVSSGDLSVRGCLSAAATCSFRRSSHHSMSELMVKAYGVDTLAECALKD